MTEDGGDEITERSVLLNSVQGGRFEGSVFSQTHLICAE